MDVKLPAKEFWVELTVVRDLVDTETLWFFAAIAAGAPSVTMVAAATAVRVSERKRALLFIRERGRKQSAETCATA